MNELYFPEAVVLDREDSNDVDSRFSIYAKGYGKFFAKAKSAKKILSKLSGHLEPGSLVKIRLVGNGGLLVADVLKYGKVAVSPPDLYLLDQLLPEHDFDFAIWELLTRNVLDDASVRSVGSDADGHSPLSQVHSRLHQDYGGQAGQVVQNFDWRDDSNGSPSGLPSGQVVQNFDWRKILKALGWDPEHASCEICSGLRPTFFDIGTQSFFCQNCFAKRKDNAPFSLKRSSKDYLVLET